jgi:hypothetical protein
VSPRRNRSSSARGYGWAHQLRRKAWRLGVDVGSVACARCGLLIELGQPWGLVSGGREATSAFGDHAQIVSGGTRSGSVGGLGSGGGSGSVLGIGGLGEGGSGVSFGIRRVCPCLLSGKRSLLRLHEPVAPKPWAVYRFARPLFADTVPRRTASRRNGSGDAALQVELLDEPFEGVPHRVEVCSVDARDLPASELRVGFDRGGAGRVAADKRESGNEAALELCADLRPVGRVGEERGDRVFGGFPVHGEHLVRWSA